MPDPFPQLQTIFSHLADGLSRDIFLARLRMSLEGERAGLPALLDAVRRYDVAEAQKSGAAPANTILDLFDRYRQEPREILIYGAGQNLPVVTAQLAQQGLAAACVADRDPAKQGASRCGLPVVSPAELAGRSANAYVLVSLVLCADEAKDWLLETGIPRERIFGLHFSEKQYFGLPFLRPVANEVFVDGGAFDGDSLRDFFPFCKNNYQAVYAFEPDGANLEKAKQAFGHHPNLFFIQKGLWNASATLHFKSGEDSKSHLSMAGDVSVPVTSIDEAVPQAPTFIKMDIEGAELAALQGAEQAIRQHRPRMAICVYHKPEDILDIPAYILGLWPRYQLYLRHHITQAGETVLYAIPE